MHQYIPRLTTLFFFFFFLLLQEDKNGETLSENSCISSNTDTLSPPSKNSSISSNTELPEMITRKRKRSHGEEEEESSGTFYLEPPIFHVDLPRPYGVYHDHSHDRCGLNYRYAEDDDDYFDF
uniref:uncharacterized protein LOC122589893 n=1 Tax=Erigeron canadensis TaxID=72917 RepID=UPI001CB9A877|nr:uncharacterized protein LOC122589893 [Erigeron canadensis]